MGSCWARPGTTAAMRGSFTGSIRIGRDLMDPVKLPRIAAVVPGLAQHDPILSSQGPDDVVLAVGHQQKLLLLVDRKSELPHRTYPQCFGAYSELLHEFPLLGEHLHPVIDTIADIHQPIP